TRLSTAESAITQTKQEIGLKVNSTDVYKKTEIDPKLNAKANSADVYTKAQTDGKVNAKVDTTVYNSKMAEIKATTDSITQTVSSVDKKVTGIAVGGRNLLLASKKAFNTTDYLINQYTLSENWVAGQEYTFVIKGSVPAGQKLGIWQNGGSNNVGYATTTYVNGVTYVTFKAVATTAGNEKKLFLFNYPSKTTQTKS
ncbi:hypothetical protein ACQH7H_24240, partial [Escherichia coli]|uniref:hypothetical protein n=1 Tax=Escherichia coli TaxID=562 RepID=UPI003CF10CFD